MAILTRDLILNADDLPRELTEVPEWGGEVYVRGLTGEERDDYEASMIRFVKRGKEQDREFNLKNVKARLVVRCVTDESGKRMFSDSEVAILGKKSAAALNRIVDVCQRLSGLTEKEVEQIEGNSEETQGEGSTSG